MEGGGKQNLSTAVAMIGTRFFPIQVATFSIDVHVLVHVFSIYFFVPSFHMHILLVRVCEAETVVTKIKFMTIKF